MKENIVQIDHVGIATKNLEKSSIFWKMIGLVQVSEDEIVKDQGVKVRYLSSPNNNEESTRIELLEPLGEDTPIGKFLSKKGPGIQQLCIRVSNLESTLDKLFDAGIELIDRTPKKGSNGALIAFIHPRSTGGVLVELSQHE